MLKVELELTDKAAAKLQLVVDDFNAATGRDLTLEEWVLLYLEEKAIGEDMNADVEEHKKEVDADLPRWIAARRRQRLQELH